MLAELSGLNSQTGLNSQNTAGVPSGLRSLSFILYIFSSLAEAGIFCYSFYMIKAILLDGDGVTLKQHRYFSDIYAEENNLSKEIISPFFKGELVLCQKGQADLKEKLEPYLLKWGTNDSTDQFLHKWFTEETEPD